MTHHFKQLTSIVGLSILLFGVSFATAAIAATIAIDDENLPSNVTLSEEERSTELEEGVFPIIQTKDTDEGIVFTADNAVVINQDTSSDAYLAGNTITVASTVGGDLFAAGNTIAITGDIMGSARLAGNTVTITGDIGDNVLIFANTVHISEDSAIQGHANIYASTIVIDGSVNGETDAYAERMVFNGQMYGTVTSEAERVTVGENAELHEATAFSSVAAPRINSNAKGTDLITFTQLNKEYKNTYHNTRSERRLFGWLSSFVFFSVIGLFLILLWPKQMQKIAEVMHSKPGQTWMHGILFAFLMLFGGFALIFTLIGIPITLLLWLLLGISLVFARIFTGMMLGRHFVNSKRFKNKKKQEAVQFIVGYFILSIIISLPLIGWFVAFLAGIWGIGGFLAVMKKKR